MKLSVHISCFAVVLLLLSSAAYAEGCGDICLPSLLLNTGGTITFDPTTQTLTMTTDITSIFTAGRQFTGNFGTITMTTGPLISGSVFTHSALFDGGTFTVTTNGQDLTPDGVLYEGTFSTVRWRQVKKTNSYVFAGMGSVTSSIGFLNFSAGANVFQFVTLDGTDQFSITSGRVGILPEPGTFGLLGTGLGVVAGFVRRRSRKGISTPC
jgi:hypothetical protein